MERLEEKKKVKEKEERLVKQEKKLVKIIPFRSRIVTKELKFFLRFFSFEISSPQKICAKLKLEKTCKLTTKIITFHYEKTSKIRTYLILSELKFKSFILKHTFLRPSLIFSKSFYKPIISHFKHKLFAFSLEESPKKIYSSIMVIKSLPIQLEKFAPLETEYSVEGRIEETPTPLQHLFIKIGGSWIDEEPFKLTCIVLQEKEYREIIEDIIVSKYKYHGEYEVESKFLGEPRPNIEQNLEDILKSPNIKIISLIISKGEEEKIKTILREHRSKPLTFILAPNEISEFDRLKTAIEKVPDTSRIFLSFNKNDEKQIEKICQLIGIEVKDLKNEVADLNISPVDIFKIAKKVQESRRKEWQRKLASAITEGKCPWFENRESETHYLMKKIVYYYLTKVKRKVKEEELKVEEPIQIENNIVKIVPDIWFDDECWEVETGIPCEEEKGIIIDWKDPVIRLRFKIKKYAEIFKNKELHINIVLPNDFFNIFKDKLKFNIKKELEDTVPNLHFWTINWSTLSLERVL
jgi:hypothetical protein